MNGLIMPESLGNLVLTAAIADGQNGIRLATICGLAILVTVLIVVYVFSRARRHRKKRENRRTEQPVYEKKPANKAREEKRATEKPVPAKKTDVVPAEPLQKPVSVPAKAADPQKYNVDEIEFRATVISVRNVTMNFRVATENVSGLKEYMIQKLKKQISYRDFKALDNVSFDVYKGEVIGIIGTNGSGKSTLLRIVSGALKPTSGSVLVNRRKLQLLTLGTGFDLELTARENVYLNGSIIGYSRKFIDEHYDEIVEFAELQDFMEEKVKNFSSGMVSRLGFAIATAGGAAEILILDEVLSVGDEFFRKKSLAKIKEMIHGGATVLMVSHSMDTIIQHCTKAVWIEKGVLQMVGEPKAVCDAYRKMNDGRERKA